MKLHLQVGELFGKFCGYTGWHECFVPHYDVDWKVTGPLIEKYKISIDAPKESSGNVWVAHYNYTDGAGYEHGKTPLEAVCNLLLSLGRAGRL